MRLRRWPLRLMTAAGLVVALVLGVVGAALPGPSDDPALQIHKTSRTRFGTTSGGEPVFVLVVGNDFRPGVGGHRADALHLVGVDPDSGRATILNIPRDTWVNIPGRGFSKINAANTFGGPGLQAAAVTSLTGIPVDFVVMTDFHGFINMVDRLGGLVIDVPYAMNDVPAEAVFSPGRQRLIGGQALAFSRTRKLPGGDFERTTNQARVMLAALAQLRSAGTSPASVARYLDVLLGEAELHGVSIPDLYRLGQLALNLDPANVRSVTMPGSIGTAGGQSVVFATAGAQAIFADMADDGVVG